MFVVNYNLFLRGVKTEEQQTLVVRDNNNNNNE